MLLVVTRVLSYLFSDTRAGASWPGPAAGPLTQTRGIFMSFGCRQFEHSKCYVTQARLGRGKDGPEYKCSDCSPENQFSTEATADNMKLLVSSALLVGVALADPGHHHGYRGHGYRTYGYRSHGHHGYYGKRDAEPVAVAEAEASAEPGYYGYGGYGLGYGYGGYGLGYGGYGYSGYYGKREAEAEAGHHGYHGHRGYGHGYGYRSYGHHGHHYGKRAADAGHHGGYRSYGHHGHHGYRSYGYGYHG